MQLGAGAFAAGSATWNLNPISGDWDTSENWTPAGVPVNTAIFDTSNITGLTFSRPTNIGNIVFNPAADPYGFTILVNSIAIDGSGVTNNSEVVQNFIADADDHANTGYIVFYPPAAAGGANVTYTSHGRRFSAGGSANTQFQGGTAGQATFINEGALASGGVGGALYFFCGATAAQATIINKAGLVSGAPGGVTAFSAPASHGGEAVITNEGATVNGAGGGTTVLDYHSDGGSATLIALGGTNGGGGGGIKIVAGAAGGEAITKIYGNGYLDVSGLYSDSTSIGSLEGDGNVFSVPTT
jgi:hypothetical protein